IILFPLFGFTVKYFYGRLRRLTRERSQALAEVQGHLHERVQGIPVTRSFAIEDYEQEQFAKRNKHFLQRAMKHVDWNARTFAATNTITDLAPLLVIGFGGYQVVTGDLTVGGLAAFVGYMERVYNPLRRLINSSTTLVQAIASIDRVMEFMNEKYDVKDKEDAIELGKVDGRVDIENVSFRYEENERDVLKNITFLVKKGEKISYLE